MSTVYRVYCETDDVEGPMLRVGWQASRVSVADEDQGAWIRFLEEHEYCELRLTLGRTK